MSKRVKELVAGALEAEFGSVTEAAVVDFTGVNANDNNRLRGGLKSKDVHVRTVKNSLARRAFDRIGLSVLGAYLDGPCALAYGGESIVDCLRALDEWRKQVPAFKIKAVYLDGEILEGAAAEDVVKWPNRPEMIGAIVARAMSPGSKVAGAIVGPGGQIAGQIKALIETLEEGQGEPDAVAEAAAEPEPDAVAEAAAEPEPEPKAAAEAAAEPEAEPEAEAVAESAAEVKAEAVAEVEPEAEAGGGEQG